jgi:hypothetical protein
MSHPSLHSILRQLRTRQSTSNDQDIRRPASLDFRFQRRTEQTLLLQLHRMRGALAASRWKRSRDARLSCSHGKHHSPRIIPSRSRPDREKPFMLRIQVHSAVRYIHRRILPHQTFLIQFIPLNKSFNKLLKTLRRWGEVILPIPLIDSCLSWGGPNSLSVSYSPSHATP